MRIRVCIAAWILVSALCASASPEDGNGEVLHNGIRLAKRWPPTDVTWEDITARRPHPTPPYLESPPAVIPIDVGRQLFVDDFLVESSTLTRTFHQVEYYSGNPVNSHGMAFSNGVWHDPQDGLFKMWYRNDDGSTGYATSSDGIDWSERRTVRYSSHCPKIPKPGTSEMSSLLAADAWLLATGFTSSRRRTPRRGPRPRRQVD